MNTFVKRLAEKPFVSHNGSCCIFAITAVLLIYASHDRMEERLNIATEILEKHMDEVKQSIETEQKVMRWMETAFCENEESTPREAEIRLLVFISEFANADK